MLLRSLGKYLIIMAVLEILLFHITNKSNLTLPYRINLEPPSLTLSWATKGLPFGALKLNFQHMVPDDLFKKIPKFDKIKSRSAKVHKCRMITTWLVLFALFPINIGEKGEALYQVYH